ncbi:hypothetical protein [Larkinella soli]|uniref:hypothetical protein n=1 Tax=Larkinella soli TaxID=1770527 RepID=UPI000FFBEACC|nr:hypothetical protein [Larkinella soli]
MNPFFRGVRGSTRLLRNPTDELRIAGLFSAIHFLLYLFFHEMARRVGLHFDDKLATSLHFLTAVPIYLGMGRLAGLSGSASVWWTSRAVLVLLGLHTLLYVSENGSVWVFRLYLFAGILYGLTVLALVRKTGAPAVFTGLLILLLFACRLILLEAYSNGRYYLHLGSMILLSCAYLIWFYRAARELEGRKTTDVNP